MKILGSLILLLVLSHAYQASAQTANYEQLKAEAERLYAASSYALAHELYTKADALELPASEARWVDFRLADTLWRAQAATNTADTTKYERAQKQLEELVRVVERAEDRDRVWAEAHESLGDFFWARRDSRQWHAAWPHYQQALDWWAGARDIEQARSRYLKIVWTAASPPHADDYYYYGYYGNTLPQDVLENAARVARSEEDKTRTHYLLAMTLRSHGDIEQRQRAAEEFEAALKAGKRAEWYDDALYHYAEWLSSQGRFRLTPEGQWQQEPDFPKALALFRRLVSEYRQGETRYYEQAKQQADEISRPSVGVYVSNIFLPDSEIQFHVNWRNVKRVHYSITPVELTRDVHFAGKDDDAHAWLKHIRPVSSEVVKSWSKETGDRGQHVPAQEPVRVEGRLPVGAYLLEAKAEGGATARELVLVSDASLVIKTSGRRTLVYFCDALTGAPLHGARVKLWERFHVKDDEWAWRASEKQTDGDGLALFDLAGTPDHRGLFVAAARGDRQSFGLGNRYHHTPEPLSWKIYAFTDRPAYRPRETVQWKLIARKRSAAGAYSTPTEETVEFEINDPRGAKVKEGRATLNSFGSAWGALELTDAMPLGEYRVTFWTAGRQSQIGGATLFRLEEYKLPEFRVSVETPEEGGRRKAFRLGEEVEVKIRAEYYFGGAVAEGSAEVVVYQKPFFHYYRPPRDYDWYYDDEANSRFRRYGGWRGQIIKRETVKLDATGRASLKFETPRGSQQDFEYTVEARVTDQSRREVSAAADVRVTRQRYYVHPRARHYIYRPQDKVTLDIKTLDANDQPVAVEGRVEVTRDYWYEVWVTPEGAEVSGEELRRLRERHRVFPPPQPAGAKTGWRLKFRGYQHDKILTQSLKTDARGEAELNFTPERDGYYRVAWTSVDRGSPIKAEAAVWVATGATTDTGYRSGGVEIIADKDTFRAGQSAPVMLAANGPDRYVLFSVEAEELDSYRVVHLTGAAKLVELQIEARHVPNIFLSAAMMSDGQFYIDTEQVVVPPVEQFLNVEVKSDREQYEPRDEGTLTVTTRDHSGRPVAAEVALGLSDESVFYIQRDYAADPRQFYYGTKRRHHVQTQSTAQQKPYMRLVEGGGKQLVDARVLKAEELPVNGRMEDSPYLRLSQVAAMNAPSARPSSGGVMDEMRSYKNIAADAVSEAEFAVGRMGERDGKARRKDDAAKSEPGAQEPAVEVRSDFRSTVFWQPDIRTDAAGQATLKVKYPDSLTSWQATARVATAGSQFGTASATTRTKKPLLVRLQAPRFFVTGDEVTVSAVVNNNTDAPVRVRPSLQADGLTVAGLVAAGNKLTNGGASAPVEVKPNSEARVDWLVRVERAGEARLKVEARGETYADAMEQRFLVHEHGLEKFLSKSGKMRGEMLSVRLDLPRERRADSTSLVVQLAPSMAVTMLDALPYLADFPYGCTEQTMSRFLPAVITAKTLKDLGLKPEAVTNKIFGGVERATAAATHPEGAKDLRRLDEMTTAGLQRLYDFQHADGGWGWWKDGDSDHFMTAYVVWGMTLARGAGVKVNESSLERGVLYLDKELVEEELNPDAQAWMLHALSAYHSSIKLSMSEFQSKAFENLWRKRDGLNAYTRALLALSAHHYGNAERARTLVQNLENGVKVDSAPDTSVVERAANSSNAGTLATAHWGEDGIFYRWSEGGVEATAFALRALLAIEPKHRLVEPVTNWLVKNRRGAQWSNTRDTAIAVLTLNDYLRASGELRPALDYEVLVNGQSVVKKSITAEDALGAPSRFQVPRELLRDGANEIQIRRTAGASPLYFSAEARFFSLEEPITPAGNEIFVRRQYFKLVGRPTLLKGYVYERLPLRDGESVASGERVEVVVTVEAKNNYEYLIFEDLKPAGLEAVQLRSGSPLYARELKSGTVERRFGAKEGGDGEVSDTTQTPQASRVALNAQAKRGAISVEPSSDSYTSRTRWVYQELRDRKVALFLDKLPEGVWEIRYDLRAEAPGRFHALPLVGQAMYVPEIRSNGTELRINVEESKER